MQGGPCHGCRRNVGQAHLPTCPSLTNPVHLGGTWVADPASLPVHHTRWPLWLRLWRRLHPGTTR